MALSELALLSPCLVLPQHHQAHHLHLGTKASKSRFEDATLVTEAMTRISLSSARYLVQHPHVNLRWSATLSSLVLALSLLLAAVTMMRLPPRQNTTIVKHSSVAT